MLPALVLVALALVGTAAPVRARHHPPGLREDEPARRATRPAECQFDKQAKELGSTWFADLGPPFGVMYCIKCECVPVQKKRRVVAKVHCRNIKKDCPEPTCASPVLLPGRCCKTCPGDVNSPDLVQEDSPIVVGPLSSVVDEEEPSMKHFGALLTGRSQLCIRRDDMTGVSVAPGVATVRFTFKRRHLYWSVMLSPSMSQPRAVSFLDRAGRLLLEHPLKRAPGIHATYEEKTEKLCGVWRRVPRDYKRLLREGSLYVALIWGDEHNSSMDSALSGRINRYPALSTEMFTSLLEPENPPVSFAEGAICDDTRILGQEDGWWGGTAIVTAAAGAAPSLHIALLYNGIFAALPQEQAVRIQLTLPDKNQTIIDEVQKVVKPSSELNVLEVSTPVSSAELRPLVRSRLQLTVEAVGMPERRIVGVVRQKATCEVYHAPLLTERAPASPAPEGLTMLYIDKDGSLVYDIQVADFSLSNPKITLEEEQSKRQVEIMSTWTGVLAKPSARIFPPLYDDQLAIHIGADTGPPILHGRLTSRPLPDAASAGPALLRRTNARGQTPATLTPIAGLAWLSVDALCGLYYEVVVSGSSAPWSAWLEGRPGPEGGTRALSGSEGCVLEPSPSELAALHAGTASLELRAADNSSAVLHAQLPQITVPPSCLPSELTATDKRQQMMTTTPYNSVYSASCFTGGRYYDDGAQWILTESCHMCVCVHGTTRCDPVRCPNVTCSVPTIQPQGQCCPVCTNSTTAVWNESPGCQLAGQYHAPGSSWHPYLAPRGYDTCAVCTCEYSSRQVRCDRVRCPPLRCAEREAYRPDKKSCCRVCPEERTKPLEEEAPKDQPRTAEEILAEGGCKFPDGPLPNGKEAHPSIHSHGEQRCVTCRCKDGELTCIRKRCGRAACSRRGRASGAGGGGDACCACARRGRRPRAPAHRPPPPPRLPS